MPAQDTVNAVRIIFGTVNLGTAVFLAAKDRKDRNGRADRKNDWRTQGEQAFVRARAELEEDPGRISLSGQSRRDCMMVAVGFSPRDNVG